MILLIHLILGAAIASHIKIPVLALILAFLSHYFLDFIPHVEYDIKNIKEKHWRKSLPEILKVILDFSLGILLIFVFSENQPIIYICALAAMAPDGLTFLSALFPNKILAFHNNIHRKRVHFLKDKKISSFWRILSQITMAVISIFLLRF
ncbi:MAG: hypothetical protein AAB509_02630 [Patescibacteria group bacterium]